VVQATATRWSRFSAAEGGHDREESDRHDTRSGRSIERRGEDRANPIRVLAGVGDARDVPADVAGRKLLKNSPTK